MQTEHEPIDYVAEVRVACQCGAHVVLNHWNNGWSITKRCPKCGRGYGAEVDVTVYGVNLDAGGVRMAAYPSSDPT